MTPGTQALGVGHSNLASYTPSQPPPPPNFLFTSVISPPPPFDVVQGCLGSLWGSEEPMAEAAADDG